MARKEHLIEVMTTLYVAGAGALLLQDWSKFWLVHFRSVFVLTPLVLAFTLWFILEQFQMWSEGARISNAAQSLLTKWTAAPAGTRNLAPTPLLNSGVLV